MTASFRLPPLVADGGELRLARRVALFVYGRREVEWPEDVDDPEELLPDGREFGWVAKLDDSEPGLSERRFVRADVKINAAEGYSDVEQVLDDSALRAGGEVYFESVIEEDGLGLLLPGVDFRQGDLVDVRFWGRILKDQLVTSIDWVDGKPSVALGGQSIRDTGELARARAEMVRLINGERADRVDDVSKVSKRVDTVDEKAQSAQASADEADEKAEGADKKAEDADSKAQGAQEAADAADQKAEDADKKAQDAQNAVDTLETVLDPIMDFAQAYMPSGLGFTSTGRLPFRAQRGPAKGVRIENNGMRLLGAGAWQITCEVTPSWIRLATRRIIYRIYCNDPQGNTYAYQEFIDDTTNEAHTVSFGADFVVPAPNYFVEVRVSSIAISRKHLGGWAVTRLVAKRWSSEFINPPGGGASDTDPEPTPD